ncbi:MAG: hypothetical protein K1X66_04005 [Verrucomicrobiae bacterium]|nr:hypothetical protein [Verrucomicrobiae bacterium]
MKRTVTYLIVAGLLSCFFPAYSQSFAKQGVFIDSSGSVMTGKAQGWCVKTDGSDNIYFIGSYEEAAAHGFLQLDNQLMPIVPGEKNICILKLNSSGVAVWSKTIQGLTDNKLFVADLDLDSNGNIFVAGLFAGKVDLNPDAGVANLTSTGSGQNVFLLKLKNDGSFEWVKHFKAVDATGKSFLNPAVAASADGVVIGGSFEGKIDLDPGFGINIATSAGNNDIFIVKLNQTGGVLWSRHIGGSNVGGENGFGDNVTDVIMDRDKNIWVTGDFWGNVDFDPGDGIDFLTLGGSYVLKLDSSGNHLLAKKFTGGVPYKLGLDQNLNVFVTGSFKDSVDFDPSANVFNLDAGNNIHTFVVSLTPLGIFRWAKHLGTDGGWVFPSSIAVNASGVYVAGGFTYTQDFNPDAGVFNLNSAGSDDIYLVKLTTTTGAFQWAKHIGSGLMDTSLSVALDLSGNLITTGYFQGKVDFNPNAGIVFLDSSLPTSHRQLYVLKMKTDGTF